MDLRVLFVALLLTGTLAPVAQAQPVQILDQINDIFVCSVLPLYDFVTCNAAILVDYVLDLTVMVRCVIIGGPVC